MKSSSLLQSVGPQQGSVLTELKIVKTSKRNKVIHLLAYLGQAMSYVSWCIWVTYTLCIWFQSLLGPFFQIIKKDSFWAKLRRVQMAWTIFLNFPQFFRLKNWCKITSRKESSLNPARARAGQGVKLLFLSKKCIFRAKKGIFSKSSFYTKIFSDPKYTFSVSQKKILS